jgi:hypothetical protein
MVQHFGMVVDNPIRQCLIDPGVVSEKLPGQGAMEVGLAVVILGNPRDNTQGTTLSTARP